MVVSGRFPIEEITPTLAGGEYPAKAVVGELVPIGAVSYREGHDALGLNVVWHGPDGEPRPFTRMSRRRIDRWHATIRPDAVGEWTFTVEAFADPYLTWRQAVTTKIEAGQGARELANDLAVGAAVLERPRRCRTSTRPRCKAAVAALRDDHPDPGRAGLPGAGPGRAAVAAPGAGAGHRRAEPRGSGWTGRGRSSPPGTSCSRARRARWSTGPARRCGTAPSPPPPSGCPASPTMGFDVVYLPPIHPIGRINRKGRNNALVARPDDVGSPWAIGSAEGGHDAIHPELGTVADFRAFVAAASDAGPRGRARPRPAVRAGPSVGHRAPGMVHHAARRHDRLRGEPAEEVPGHLPAELRPRSGRAAGRGAAGGAALGRTGREDLPGRQSRTPSRPTSGTG